MDINLISDFSHLPKEHGTHTAYMNVLELLNSNHINVSTNSLKNNHHITHIHSVGPLALYKILTSKVSVLTAHVIPETFIESIIGARYWYRIASAYLKFFYNSADIVIAVSPYEIGQLRKMGITRPIEFIPNPIDEKLFRKDLKLRSRGRRILNFKKDDFVVIGVGQIQPRKGIGDFIKTARLLPGIKFAWVGANLMKSLSASTKEFTQLLENLPKNVKMVGKKDYSDMPTFYNAADIFLFPSYQENAPMAVAEAAMCGLPVILRDIEEYKFLYGKNYFSAKSINGYSRIIKELKENKKLFKNACQTTSELARPYKFESTGRQLIALYTNILYRKSAELSPVLVSEDGVLQKIKRQKQA